MGKKKNSKPKVTDADNRTVCQSEELQDKNDEESIILKVTSLLLPAKMLAITLNRSKKGNSGLKYLEEKKPSRVCQVK